jgi:SPX domain protein involved in polyphosphate accumulation
MPRLEYKYLVSMSELGELRRMILPHVEMDPYAAARPNNEYTVRSIYLDTPDLAFCHEKLDGLKERAKFRIRGYNEYSPAAPVFLEIKRKTGMAVVKKRSRLLYQNLIPFLETSNIEEHIPALAEYEDARDNAGRFLFHYHNQALRPSVTVAYEREAFYFKFDHGLRITFDKNLRSHNNVTLNSLFQETQALYALPNRFVLEIKTNSGLPQWVRLVLNRLDLHYEAISKYVICVLLCHENGYNGFRAMPHLGPIK